MHLKSLKLLQSEYESDTNVDQNFDSVESFLQQFSTSDAESNHQLPSCSSSSKSKINNVRVVFN